MNMKSASKYFAERNGGKTPEQMMRDDESINPTWAAALMRDYAKIYFKEAIRGELINYDHWCAKQGIGPDINTAETNVDLFLKSRKL